MGPSRKSKASQPSFTRTLVVDNGGYTIKAGFVGAAPATAADGSAEHTADDGQQEPRVIPNCIARDRSRRVYVGSELERCRDFSEMQFRRPVEKGFIVSWEAEREIWSREFFDPKAPLRCDPAETRLLLAEHSNGLPALQSNCDQIVFEEFQFASYARTLGPTWNAFQDIQSIFQTPRTPDAPPPALPAEAVLLVDSGFSSTTVTPLLLGRPIHSAIRRVEVGGRLLTGYLARLLSLRHYDMRAEWWIVNEMKEKVSFVSSDFARDLEACWKGTRPDATLSSSEARQRDIYRLGSNGIACDYVLPDFSTRLHGEVRPYDPTVTAKARRMAAARGGGSTEDVLTLRNERFTVPELLFHPSDSGLGRDMAGLADAAMDSLSCLPVGLWPAMLANVVIVGGNACIPGLVERLQKELLVRAPDECVVRVASPADPVGYCWKGGRNMVRQCLELVEKLCVTKQEYEEYGGLWTARRFAAGLEVPG